LRRRLLSEAGLQSTTMAARKDSIGELTDLMGTLMRDEHAAAKEAADSPPAVAHIAARDKPASEVIQEAVFKPLRTYQQQIIDVVRALLDKEPSRALLYLPTGGGKTRIAGETAKWAMAKGWRVAFVVNRVALVDQSARAFQEIGISAGHGLRCERPASRRTCAATNRDYADLGEAALAADRPLVDGLQRLSGAGGRCRCRRGRRRYRRGCLGGGPQQRGGDA
jgi:hypothetical protein